MPDAEKISSLSVHRRPDWVVANIGSAWIAFPQHQVRGLEIAPAPSDELLYPDGCALQGWVESRGAPCPIIAIDEHLNPRLVPSQGRYVVVLKALHQPIGILVGDAELLDADEVGDPQPLPQGMEKTDSEVSHLLDIDEQRIAAVLDAVKLGARISQLPELVKLVETENDDGESIQPNSLAQGNFA